MPAPGRPRRRVGHPGRDTTETQLITHVVLMRFSDRADAPEAKRRLETLAGAVPALRSLRVDLDALGLDGSYDLCLVTTHDDAAGLRAYQEDPAHVALLDWLRPRLTARAAVDHDGGARPA